MHRKKIILVTFVITLQKKNMLENQTQTPHFNTFHKYKLLKVRMLMIIIYLIFIRIQTIFYDQFYVSISFRKLLRSKIICLTLAHELNKFYKLVFNSQNIQKLVHSDNRQLCYQYIRATFWLIYLPQYMTLID